ncbi:hypothetical protein EZS27_019953 [termite gut metagenome]|uniref:Uncharacterized protein n=1 Tax=termite gut metagenome TaxID=433724 RepID=A0A5J4RDL1_9ZZZZ
MGVKIASTSAGIVSGNYSTGIYNLPVKSPWEGKYNVTVDWELPESLASEQQYFPESFDVNLSTQGPGVVRGTNIGDFFSGWTNYKFNPDGSIGIAFSSASITNISVQESNSNINTLTFSHKTSFSHPSYGDFVLIETYIKTRD